MAERFDRRDPADGRRKADSALHCAACRAELAERQRFCTACGAAVAQPCAACGHTNPAAARFCGQCGSALAPGAASGHTAAVALPPAERRQISVLFCDLVDSTVLSTRLDPEDLRAVFGAYHRRCAEVIARAGGFVAKYLGDGVLAYFGYPQANENNAEQAVRAGLALVEAIGNLGIELGDDLFVRALRLEGNQGQDVPAAPIAGDGWAGPATASRLQVRVGIASGQVIVGDLLGQGSAQERMVVGETPNLAARLQERAAPGQVLVAAGTHRLAGGLFEYREMGSQELKGFAAKVPAYQVLGLNAWESRFRGRHESGLTPLCDRRQELPLLLELWEQARRGEASAVLIIGEPGIGKSRLIAALLEATAGGPQIRLRLHGLPHYETTAFHPVVGYLRFAAGFARDDTPAQKLAKLEALLRPSEPSADEVALFADLLSLPHPDRGRLEGLTPQRRREKTLEALLTRTDRLAAQRPVLIAWEDLHWADPSSLDFVRAFIGHLAAQRTMIVMSARPGFSPPWVDHPLVTRIALTRLAQDDTECLVAGVTGGRALPDEVLAQIVARSDGVPLFVEELSKAILESGLLHEEGGRYVASALEARLAIPATLQDSLTARLDRLAPWREVVQAGAALGREFAFDVLAAVTGQPEAQLRAGLDELVGSDLVLCRGAPPDAVYTFRHALVQDAAGGMMLRGDRQRMHARIVAVLEQSFPEIVLTQPERVGQHCLEAGLADKAIGYWLTACRHALARSTTDEAIALLHKALRLLPNIAEPARRDQLELDLRITLGQTLSAARGYADPEADAAFARGHELCEQLNRPDQLAPVLYGQFLLRFHRLDMDWVRERGEEACRVGEAAGDPILRWLGHRMCGSRLASLGEFAAARAHLERCLAFSDTVDREGGGALPPEGPKVGALFHLVRVLCCLGDLVQTRARVQELMVEARRRPNGALFLGLSGACIVDWCLRSTTRKAMQTAEELLTFSVERGFAQGRAWGNLFRGRCIALSGNPREAVPLLTSGVAEYRSLGIKAGLPMYLTSLAEAHGLAGQPEAGLACFAEAESLAEADQNRWQWPEALRIRGVLLRAIGDHAAAAACFEQALAVARSQEARLWELRAAISLVECRAAEGKASLAPALLGPLLSWFGEAELDELRQVRELLAQASGGT